jgi:gliding motility-associated-like protein
MALNDVYIPNVITPNNDGKNDVFVIDDKLIYSELKMYNRWGRNIYESKKYSNNWDGSEVAAGVYYYSIIDECNQNEYKGWLQLIK